MVRTTHLSRDTSSRAVAIQNFQRVGRMEGGPDTIIKAGLVLSTEIRNTVILKTENYHGSTILPVREVFQVSFISVLS